MSPPAPPTLIKSFNPISLLETRTKNLSTTDYSYKTGGFSPYGLDVVFTGEPDVDESKMSAWLPIAEGTSRDGVGDVVEVVGIDCSRHKINPQILWNHGKDVVLPIALAETREEPYEYTFRIDPVNRTAGAWSYFYQGRDGEWNSRLGWDGKQYDHAVFAEQLFHMLCKRLLRSGSLGYQVVEADQLPPDYSRGIPQGLHLKRVLMLEGSLVALPANSLTTRKSFPSDDAFAAWQDDICCLLGNGKCCGKNLSPYLVKSLQPYQIQRKEQISMPSETKSHGDCRCGGTCGKCKEGKSMEAQTKGSPNVGEIVKIRLPHPTEPKVYMTAAGTVKRIMPDGKLEIKTQAHGYHIVDPSELVKSLPAQIKAWWVVHREIHGIRPAYVVQASSEQGAIQAVEQLLGGKFSGLKDVDGPYDDKYEAERESKSLPTREYLNANQEPQPYAPPPLDDPCEQERLYAADTMASNPQNLLVSDEGSTVPPLVSTAFSWAKVKAIRSRMRKGRKAMELPKVRRLRGGPDEDVIYISHNGQRLFERKFPARMDQDGSKGDAYEESLQRKIDSGEIKALSTLRSGAGAELVGIKDQPSDSIAPEKAREMLKNPPHGKPLTDKQRHVMQAAAHKNDKAIGSCPAIVDGKRCMLQYGHSGPHDTTEYRQKNGLSPLTPVPAVHAAQRQYQNRVLAAAADDDINAGNLKALRMKYRRKNLPQVPGGFGMSPSGDVAFRIVRLLTDLAKRGDVERIRNYQIEAGDLKKLRKTNAGLDETVERYRQDLIAALDRGEKSLPHDTKGLNNWLQAIAAILATLISEPGMANAAVELMGDDVQDLFKQGKTPQEAANILKPKMRKKMLEVKTKGNYPTRMQVQDTYDKICSTGASEREAIRQTEQAMDVRGIRVNSSGDIVWFERNKSVKSIDAVRFDWSDNPIGNPGTENDDKRIFHVMENGSERTVTFGEMANMVGRGEAERLRQMAIRKGTGRWHAASESYAPSAREYAGKGIPPNPLSTNFAAFAERWDAAGAGERAQMLSQAGAPENLAGRDFGQLPKLEQAQLLRTHGKSLIVEKKDWRDDVRELQDDLLATSGVRQFILAQGENKPLWEGGPSASQLRNMIFPKWQQYMERLLNEMRGKSIKGISRVELLADKLDQINSESEQRSFLEGLDHSTLLALGALYSRQGGMWPAGQKTRDLIYEIARGAKSLPGIRMKYRAVKRYRRTIKKSVPGSVGFSIREKDLDAVKAEAKSSGCKASWTGDGGGLVRVKLTGADEAMGAIAKKFSRKR